MGLLSKVFRRSRHSRGQADNRSVEQQLIDAEAWLDKVLMLPPSAFGIKLANGVIIQHSIDAKDESIMYALARVMQLRTKVRLSQRQPQTGADYER